MYTVLGLAAGALLSMQTAVNARLRDLVRSPYVSALISCVISLVIVLLLLCVGHGTGRMAPPAFSGLSWWMFLGGVFGVFIVTGCIVLFPILGAVQTTVLPVFGQILLGILTDLFGWFGGTKKAFTGMDALGIAALAAGIICIVILPERTGREPGRTEKHEKKMLWQILAVLVGMASAAQASVNGRLGTVLGSPLYAACISVSVVVILTLVINIRGKTFGNLQALRSRQTALWALPGGVFGAVFVLINASAAPVIGTGSLMVFSVSGQLLFSVLIEHYGWFGSPRRRIRRVQIVGLLLMLAGVILVEML